MIQASPLHPDRYDEWPTYDEYADSDWYDMEATLHSLYQDLQAA